MRCLLIAAALVLITGCSPIRPDNAWQYDAAASAKNAEKYFLEGKYLLSQGEFRRAEKSAKQSGDITPLARLYLGKCALNRAVLLEDACSEYADIAALSDDIGLKSYYALLRDMLDTADIDALPDQYRGFASEYLKGDPEKIRRSLKELTPLTSKMVASSLARKHLDEQLIEAIIDEASHFGYRRAVIAWMRHLVNVTDDTHKRAALEQKIRLLTQPGSKP